MSAATITATIAQINELAGQLIAASERREQVNVDLVLVARIVATVGLLLADFEDRRRGLERPEGEHVARMAASALRLALALKRGDIANDEHLVDTCDFDGCKRGALHFAKRAIPAGAGLGQSLVVEGFCAKHRPWPPTERWDAETKFAPTIETFEDEWQIALGDFFALDEDGIASMLAARGIR